MSNPTHLLAQQIIGKNSLEECSLDDVQRTANKYPYFAPAQFLLLQKLRQLGLDTEADIQYKKAVLFYPNPAAFELFISSGKFFGGTDEFEEEATQFYGIDETNNEHASPEDEMKGTTLFKAEEADVLPAADSTINHEVLEQAIVEVQPISTDPLVEETESNGTASEKNDVGSLALEEVPETFPQLITEEPQQELKPEPLAFEPYHTVDYFASQGIKVSQDEVPKDRLGKQVKSFTEWLKVMKRLPASQTAGTAESPAEKGVETLASRSVSENEVLTEAMADVWIKQGAHGKALDIYNKLSLHNPSKRDYFAAKIENLKQF